MADAEDLKSVFGVSHNPAQKRNQRRQLILRPFSDSHPCVRAHLDA